MILKGCVLAKELSQKAGYASADRYRKICKDRYFVFDNKAYVPTSSLTMRKDMAAVQNCTKLDDYLPLVYFARFVLNVAPQSVRQRLKFMKATGREMFGYKRAFGADFIEIPKELQDKFKRGLTYTITDWKRFDDYENVVDHYVFGDWCIVFLE